MFEHPNCYFFRHTAPTKTPVAYYSAPMLVPAPSGELRVARVSIPR